MNKLVLIFLIFVLCGTQLNVKSVEAKTFKEDGAFTQLNKHIALNENEIAWQNALSLEDEYLGDTDFDFLYGLIALRVNEEERAVFAFERVVANRPNWRDAQYYLAAAYY